MGIFAWVSDQLEQVGNAFDVADQTVNNFTTEVSNTVSGAVSAVDNAIDTTVDAVNGAVNRVENTVDAVGHAISHAPEIIEQKIDQGIDAAGNFAKDATEASLDFSKEMAMAPMNIAHAGVEAIGDAASRTSFSVGFDGEEGVSIKGGFKAAAEGGQLGATKELGTDIRQEIEQDMGTQPVTSTPGGWGLGG